MKPVRTVGTEEVKAVQDFLALDQRLEDFKFEHYELFQEFAFLLDERNIALEEAAKEVRALGVSCGPFQACGENSKIDLEKLYDELGEEEFLKSGGIIETKRVLALDKKKFEMLVESGSIPGTVVEHCFSQAYKYKAPSKGELP